MIQNCKIINVIVKDCARAVGACCFFEFFARILSEIYCAKCSHFYRGDTQKKIKEGSRKQGGYEGRRHEVTCG